MDGIPAPNPNYEIPVQNVTGNANIKTQNKNLFDFNNEIKAGNNDLSYYEVNYTKNNQVLNLNGTINATNTFVLGDLALKAGTYTISIDVLGGTVSGGLYVNVVTANQSKQLTLLNSNVNLTFTVTKSIEKVTIYIAKNRVFTNYKIRVQLEQGSTATSYVEHKEQNLPFTLGTQRIYKRSYLADDGSHNLRKRIVFDGTENWSIFNLSETKKQFYINDVSLKVKHNNTEPTVISNYFISAVVSDRSIKTNITFSTTNGLGFVTEDILTLEDWKAWVTQKYTNNHPLIAEYDLTEEEIIPYSETQQAQYNAIKKAMSYDEQTNISSTSDELGMIIDAEAIQNINNVLSTINSRLDLVEG